MHALHYWYNSFIERMLSEADNEQRSKQTPSNPSAARTDTKKDGRRGKGVDYSSTSGGSSASTVDNEDFERCCTVCDYKIGLPYSHHTYPNISRGNACLASSIAC